MQAFEDKAVCSRMSHSWHVGDTSTLYNPGVIMTSYTVQFTLPLTHAHSTQDPFDHVSKFFRNFPLTSRHTESNNRSHTTELELFEVQVHFFFGSSNQTSPGFLVFLWLSMQEKPIGGGRTTNTHCTCIGPIHERVKKTPPFHILICVFAGESMHFGAKTEKDDKHETTKKSDISLRRRKLKAEWFALAKG